MQMILFITCILMWALAVIVTVILLMLRQDIKKVKDEQEKQADELEAVEVCIYRNMKQNGWKTVLCTDERKDDEVRETR